MIVFLSKFYMVLVQYTSWLTPSSAFL